MSDDDLYFLVVSLGLLWQVALAGTIFWLDRRANKLEDVIARQDDRITHVYDVLHSLETKADVKKAIEEAAEAIEAAQED